MPDLADDLRERRRAVHTRCRTLRDELKSAEADLKAIDRVLAMVSPANAASAVVARSGRPRSAAAGGGGLFDHGDLAPAALAALRGIGRPATSAEVSVAMLADKGLPGDDPRLPGLANRVSGALNEWASKNQVQRAGNGEGRTVLWTVPT